MFSKKLSKRISSAVLFSFLTGMLPVGQIAQAATCSTSSAGTSSDACYTVKVGTSTLTVPKTSYQDVLTIPLAQATAASGALPSGGSLAFGDNLQAMTKYLSQNAPEGVEITPQTLVKSFEVMPSNMPMVVAQYDPAAAALKVDIVKSEKVFNAQGTPVLKLQSAPFTPEHGKLWAASKTYSSPTLKAMSSSGPGPNPFEQYQTTGEHFANISFAGVQVAIGHAMRANGASFGVLAVNVHRMDQQVVKSGNALRKKITTITSGYAKPMWFVMTPSSIGFRGTTSGTVPAGIEATICAVNYGENASCPEHEIVPSLVAMQDVSGDDFLSPESKIYEVSESKSGFTLLAGLLLAGAFSFGASLLMGTAGGGLASSLLSEGITLAGIPGAGVLSGAAGALSGTQVALIAGSIDAAVYGLGSFVFGGANSLTDIQKNSFVIGQVDDGAMAAVSVSGHEGATLDRLRGYTLNTDPLNTSTQLSATRDLFFGSCDPNVLGSNCAGKKGLLPRVDRYQEKTTSSLKDSMPDYVLKF